MPARVQVPEIIHSLLELELAMLPRDAEILHLNLALLASTDDRIPIEHKLFSLQRAFMDNQSDFFRCHRYIPGLEADSSIFSAGPSRRTVRWRHLL